jgi:transposase
VASVAVTRRFDLTDAQWAVLEPLLPKGKKPGRPPKWSKRQLIDGIRWRVRVGSPWRDVPQWRVYRLRPEPLAEVDEWLGRYRSLWEQRLNALHTEVARGKRQRRSST